MPAITTMRHLTTTQKWVAIGCQQKADLLMKLPSFSGEEIALLSASPPHQESAKLNDTKRDSELNLRSVGQTRGKDKKSPGLLVDSRNPGWWVEMDSNQRKLSLADLQSAPFSHSGIYPFRFRGARCMRKGGIFDKGKIFIPSLFVTFYFQSTRSYR
jgi:hypothetical protein